MTKLEIPAVASRVDHLHNAIRLEYFTIIYNVLEGIVSLVLGGLASSIALIGFGLDSFIESFSGVVVLWRFRREAQGQEDYASLESRALRFVGWSFFVLAAYILFESVRKLWLQEQPNPSLPGILLAILSLIVMPVLARKKHHSGKALKSGAMLGDSKQTLACSLLSVALLLGLGFNAFLGWWWADPIAGLTMIPWLLKEGQRTLRGDVCCER